MCLAVCTGNVWLSRERERQIFLQPKSEHCCNANTNHFVGWMFVAGCISIIADRLLARIELDKSGTQRHIIGHIFTHSIRLLCRHLRFWHSVYFAFVCTQHTGITYSTRVYAKQFCIRAVISDLFSERYFIISVGCCVDK